jgi:hypothetical protein
LNGNDNYDAGEVNLDVNGGDFLSTTAAANNVFNPDLKRPRQHEVTAVFDRELMANMAGRVAYVYKRNVGTISSVNIKRPSSDDIALTAHPGPDGNPVRRRRGSVKIYDYNAACAARHSSRTSSSTVVGPQRHVPHLEFTLNKRRLKRWGASTPSRRPKSLVPLASSSLNDDYSDR